MTDALETGATNRRFSAPVFRSIGYAYEMKISRAENKRINVVL